MQVTPPSIFAVKTLKKTKLPFNFIFIKKEKIEKKNGHKVENDPLYFKIHQFSAF
jgi:hypothetical protein